MSEHAPKLRALLAYDADALSVTGRARIEAHLAGCEVCQGELATLRLYDELSAEVRSAPVPQIDYDRMELALRREARAQARGGRALPLALLALAAAVLLGVLGLQRRETPAPMAALPSAPAAVASTTTHPPEPMPTLSGTTTATADAQVGEARATLETALHEGDVLETGPQGTLHGRLAAGTGFALGGASRLTLRRMRADGIALELERGQVSNAVRTGIHYRVEAGPYRVVVRGTRFSVRRDGDHVHVSLAEGAVAVEALPTADSRAGDAAADGRTLAVLHAPAEWDSA